MAIDQARSQRAKECWSKRNTACRAEITEPWRRAAAVAALLKVANDLDADQRQQVLAALAHDTRAA